MANYKINRIFNDESLLTFKITAFPEGQSFDSVADIVFAVKKLDDDDYADKLVEKKFTAAQITKVGTNVVTVKIETTDYENLVIGETYRAALFFKWIKDTDFDENVEQLYDLEIIQDFHNE